MSAEHEVALDDLNGTDLTPEERARAEYQRLRVTRELDEEKKRRGESQLARLRNRAGEPRHPVTPYSDVMLTEKFTVKDIADPEKVSDEVLVSHLHDYTVSEVTASLESIIADKSVRKPVRRQAVARVVNHQPHPTKHFEAFKLWNIEMLGRAGFNDPQEAMRDILTTGVPFSSVFLMIGAIAGGHLAAVFFFAAALFWSLLSVGYFFIGKDMKRKVGKLDHERHDLTLNDSIEKKRQVDIENLRQQHEMLGIPFDGEKVNTVSLTQTRQDFTDAKARIASYETDMTKALTRPAFNDITVKEVGEMISQLRKCNLLFADGADTVSATELADEVSQLWVNISVAEKRAKQIAWSRVSEDEQALLKQALDLVTHANASGNTEAMRANYYRKLKEVVEKLNEHDDIVPKLVVDEISFEVRKQIEPVRAEQQEEEARA